MNKIIIANDTHIYQLVISIGNGPLQNTQLLTDHIVLQFQGIYADMSDMSWSNFDGMRIGFMTMVKQRMRYPNINPSCILFREKSMYFLSLTQFTHHLVLPGDFVGSFNIALVVIDLFLCKDIINVPA